MRAVARGRTTAYNLNSMTLLERLADVDVPELTLRVQQIPAPTFAEADRARFAHRVFVDCGLDADVVTHPGGLTNAYARIAGAGGAVPALLISAHTDTVFPAATNLAARRDTEHGRLSGPGIGDNSLAVAALLAIAKACGAAGGPRDRADGPPPPPCDIWLVANASEEGLGDLRGIRAALDHVRTRHAAGLGAAIVLEGMALGGVYNRGIGVRRYRLTVRTAGGHSWGDYGSPSAVHELVRRLDRVVRLDMPSVPKTTMNIGVIGGGTSVNTIAAEAFAEVDLRSETREDAERLAQRVAREVGGAGSAGIHVDLEMIGNRPAGSISAEHPLVKAALDALQVAGREGELRSGSTDANALLAEGIPSVCVGVSTGGNAHRLDEYIDVDPIAIGITQLSYLIPEAARIASGSPEYQKPL